MSGEAAARARNRAVPIASVAVWSRCVRALHWALASLVVAGWLSGFGVFAWLRAHEAIGYAAAAVVAARIGHGFAARGPARFSHFVRGWHLTSAYARQLAVGRAPRHLGHNPLGGWMIVALLACVGALGMTGYLMGTDLLWGYAWLVGVHTALSWLLMALVALHLAGVLVMSLKHREVLVLAMVTGRKPAMTDDEPGGARANSPNSDRQ